jgi:hypothetical protein
VSDEILDQLISRVYDAALDEEMWRCLERDIPAALDSTSISLMTVNKAGTEARFLLKSANVTPDLARDYGAYFNRLDIWSLRAAEMGPSVVWTSGEIIDDKSLHRTEFYNDFLTRTGIAHMVGSVWPVPSDSMCTLGIHRPLSCGNYDDNAKRKVAKLLPHLQRAIGIRDRLEPLELERRAAIEALEATNLATLVVASNG